MRDEIVVLFEAETIARRIDDLVEEMAERERSERLVMIGVLRGSFMFLADLVRSLDRHRLHPRIDFMTLASYHGGTESSGRVDILRDTSIDLEGADVLLVDDILDTGRTLRFAVEHLGGKGARRVRTCVLLDKPARRVEELRADYVGFEIEDRFVVGYGLDYDNRFRELPFIGHVP